MTATMHLCFQTHARFALHVQRAYAFGAISLVRRKRHQIDFEFLQINLHLAGGLRRINMEQYALSTTYLTNRRDVLNHTDLIVHIHDRYQDGIGAQ